MKIEQFKNSTENLPKYSPNICFWLVLLSVSLCIIFKTSSADICYRQSKKLQKYIGTEKYVLFLIKKHFQIKYKSSHFICFKKVFKSSCLISYS